MITASHLPSHRNGFKFFTQSGGLNKQDIAEVWHSTAVAEQGRAAVDIVGISSRAWSHTPKHVHSALTCVGLSDKR